MATAAAFAVQGLVFSVLLTHLPQFTDEYGLSQGMVTLVVFTVVVLAGVGSLLSERLAVATSSRVALRAGLFGVAATAALIGLAPGLPVFLAAFGLYGIALGTVDAAGNMQGVAVQHVYGRSVIASFHASWSAGAIGGALWVAGGEQFGLPLVPSILAAAAVALAVAAVAGPSLLVTEPVLKPDAEAVDPLGRSGFRGPTPLLLLGVAMACFWAVDSSVSNWSALYLDDVLRASGGTLALGYALYQAAGLLSRLCGDAAVRRRGATATVRAGAALGTVGALVVVLAPGPAVAIVGFGLVGLGLPVLAPLCFAAAADVARRTEGGSPQAVDRVIARLNVFNYLGALAGSVLVGALGTIADLRLGFVLPVLLAGALIALAPAFGTAADERDHARRPAA